MSCHGFGSPLIVNCSSRNAAVPPLRTVKPLSFLNALAPSVESVAPSIAPARSAAIRACSSGSVFSVIASMYGSPCFQKRVLRTYSTLSFGSNPTIRYGPVPIASRLTLIWS